MKKYKRVLIKLSGQALAKEEKEQGIRPATIRDLAGNIKKEIIDEGCETAIVIGGGNIWRHRDQQGSAIERTVSDYMGMLATIMNSVAFQAILESLGVESRVLSAIDVPQLAEPYIRRRAIRHLEKGRVVICAGGTGNPYFTTDSAAALRASELNCGILLKATDVDGVYDKDPHMYSDAVKYDDLTFDQAIEKNLRVLDQTAFSLCREQRIPICVFDYRVAGNLKKAVRGENVGTFVHP